MEYIKVAYNLENCEEFIAELLPTFLGEIGFDSFDESGHLLNAYCPKDLFSIENLRELMSTVPCDITNISFEVSEVEDINWNARWEAESFKPIEINAECCVRPSNIEVEKEYKYDIVVNPTQSFGTGYHETTRMVMNTMMDDVPMKGLQVLDMGCGTAVLSILASGLGAARITAIDIDKWSADNAKENALMNGCNNIDVHLGDASLLEDMVGKFDVVLANINRNILLNDMHRYVGAMKKGGMLVMSGFLIDDYPMIEVKAVELGLSPHLQYEDNKWVCCSFKKEIH